MAYLLTLVHQEVETLKELLQNTKGWQQEEIFNKFSLV